MKGKKCGENKKHEREEQKAMKQAMMPKKKKK